MAGFPDIVNNAIVLPEDTLSFKITVLRQTCRKKLALFLDPDVDDINDEIGHMANYTGLAELIGYQYEEIEKISTDRKGPTHALLENWGHDTARDPTIGNLWKHLKHLQRYDAMEECAKFIIQDVEAEKRGKVAPLTRDTDPGEITGKHKTATDHHVDGNLILTLEDDQYGCPQYYDAFVCCNMDGKEDMMFVKRLIDELEDKRGIRLCIPDRNSLPGASQYDAYASLIKVRCRMMVVVVSQSYLESPSNDFCVKFAQALSPATKQKKIVPVLIEKMAMPNVLRALTLCDFTKSDMEDWNWDRLHKSLSSSDKDWNEQAPCESRRPCNDIAFVPEPKRSEKPTDSKVKTFFKNLLGSNRKK